MNQEDSLRQAQELVARAISEYKSKRLAYYSKRPALLQDILKKDVLMYALRGINTAAEWLDAAFAAHESSSEETVMGSAWQQILTDLSNRTVGAGDFLIEKDDILWVLEMKSQTNTLNGPGKAQTLRSLKQRVLDNSNFRTPRRRGVMAMIGVLRGEPKDRWITHRAAATENKEIDGFSYHYKVGAPFRSWLTGIANPAELVNYDPDQGADLAGAREDCRFRLQQELLARLNERGLSDDVQSVMRLVSDQNEPAAP